MKNLLTTAAVIAVTVTSAVAGSHQIRVDGSTYASTSPSPNSAEGHRVWTCTPTHVESGECVAVDQSYYDQQAVIQHGPWNIQLLTGTQDSDGAEVQILAFRGGISNGVASAIDKAFTDNPNVETIVLSSTGGDIQESMRLYDVFREHEVTAWVPEGRMCMSGCAEALLGASEIIITGVVGFHAAAYTGNMFTATMDSDELVTTLSNQVQKDISMLQARRQLGGMGGEFNIDVAAAEGEFLMFTSSAQLDEYRNIDCFDCVDHEPLLITVDEAQEMDAGDKVETGITMTNRETLATTG